MTFQKHRHAVENNLCNRIFRPLISIDHRTNCIVYLCDRNNVWEKNSHPDSLEARLSKKYISVSIEARCRRKIVPSGRSKQPFPLSSANGACWNNGRKKPLSRVFLDDWRAHRGAGTGPSVQWCIEVMFRIWLRRKRRGAKALLMI